MKKYKAILTHNPQDYFEGKEPDELTETVKFFDVFYYPKMDKILNMIDNGYKAIIVPIEGDDTG